VIIVLLTVKIALLRKFLFSSFKLSLSNSSSFVIKRNMNTQYPLVLRLVYESTKIAQTAGEIVRRVVQSGTLDVVDKVVKEQIYFALNGR